MGGGYLHGLLNSSSPCYKYSQNIAAAYFHSPGIPYVSSPTLNIYLRMGMSFIIYKYELFETNCFYDKLSFKLNLIVLEIRERITIFITKNEYLRL